MKKTNELDLVQFVCEKALSPQTVAVMGMAIGPLDPFVWTLMNPTIIS